MRNLLLITFILANVFFIACSKDKYTTVPQIKAKSISPGTVVKGQIITFISTFTDDEGDIQDSVLIIYNRFNGASILTRDTIPYKLDPGQVPKTRKGDIIVKIGYGQQIDYTIYRPLENVDRQASVGIIIKDNAGNHSNYAESDKITLKKL